MELHALRSLKGGRSSLLEQELKRRLTKIVLWNETTLQDVVVKSISTSFQAFPVAV